MFALLEIARIYKALKNFADLQGPKGAWHYNHVTFTPIAKNFMLYCRLIYMLSILCVRLTIKVKVGIPESFKVGWYPPPPPQKKKLGRVTLKALFPVESTDFP